MITRTRSDYISILIERIIHDLDLLTETYCGSPKEASAIHKSLNLLRDVFKLSPKNFPNEVILKIKAIQKRYDQLKTGEIPTFGQLPFKEGCFYKDRNRKYKIIQVKGTSVTIKYENGQTQILDPSRIDLKSRIYSNLVNESRSSRLAKKLWGAKLNAQELLNKIPRWNRIDNCYDCKTEVNTSCDLCYICGWFICNRCCACGCGFKREEPHY